MHRGEARASAGFPFDEQTLIKYLTSVEIALYAPLLLSGVTRVRCTTVKFRSLGANCSMPCLLEMFGRVSIPLASTPGSARWVSALGCVLCPRNLPFFLGSFCTTHEKANSFASRVTFRWHVTSN